MATITDTSTNLCIKVPVSCGDVFLISTIFFEDSRGLEIDVVIHCNDRSSITMLTSITTHKCGTAFTLDGVIEIKTKEKLQPFVRPK